MKWKPPVQYHRLGLLYYILLQLNVVEEKLYLVFK